MRKSREVNKLGLENKTVAMHKATSIFLILLVLSLVLAVAILCVAFAVEISNLRSEIDSIQQQQSIGGASGRQDNNSNMSMDGPLQLLQTINNHTQQVLHQQLNSSLAMLFQKPLQDTDNGTKQDNPSSELLYQHKIFERSIAERNRHWKHPHRNYFTAVKKFQQSLAYHIRSNNMFFQKILQDISVIESSLETLSQQQCQNIRDISAHDNAILQVNSSLEMLSQQLLQDISDIYSRIEEVNTSLSQQVNDTSVIESSLETLSQQQYQNVRDISALDNAILQVNSSLEMLSQQLLQDISDIYSRIEEVNTSLSQQVNDLQVQVDNRVTLQKVLGTLPTIPASSCADLPPSFLSDYYWVRTSSGSVVLVFCDMTLSCGGVTGGWMRVADLDFNNTDHACPSNFSERFDSDLRTCVADDPSGCRSVEYSTFNVPYSSVCGKVIAYQFGTPEAFSRLIVISTLTVDSQYLDGISFTHGSSPRQHIWSLAAGVTQSRTDRFGCPCNVGSTVSVMSSFIGDDYFCDSTASSISSGEFFPDNRLWDGEDCAPTNGCCSFNNPPWFYKELEQGTADDVEMRVCRDESGTTEGVPIESIELYVR